MSQDRETLLKRIGLSQKVFTKSQWKDAEKQAAKTGKSVTDALLAMGVLNPEKVRALSRAVDFRVGRNEDKELARVILDSGYTDEKAVESALDHQKNVYNSTGKLVRLCSLLIDGRALSESQQTAAKKILDIAKATRRPDTSPDEASD
jgi:hypothetical protein